MKPAALICLLIASAAFLPPVSLAQQPRTRTGTHRRVDPGSASQTYQILGFTITTGDDDLRDDTDLMAHLSFQDDPSYDCILHGRNASGASGNIGWDNNSTLQAPPCRLNKPMTLLELRQAVISLNMSYPGLGNPDNWNVNRVTVIAYNQGSNARACVLDVSGRPLARLTNDQGHVNLTNFPNHCR